jgi:hypothetical protein
MTNPIVQIIIIMAFGVVTGGTYYITKDPNAATSAAADIAASIEVTHLSIDDAKGNPKTISDTRWFFERWWDSLKSFFYSDGGSSTTTSTPGNPDSLQRTPHGKVFFKEIGDLVKDLPRNPYKRDSLEDSNGCS